LATSEALAKATLEAAVWAKAASLQSSAPPPSASWLGRIPRRPRRWLALALGGECRHLRQREVAILLLPGYRCHQESPALAMRPSSLRVRPFWWRVPSASLTFRFSGLPHWLSG